MVCPFDLVSDVQVLMPLAKICRVKNATHAVVSEEHEHLADTIGLFFSGDGISKSKSKSVDASYAS